MIEYFLDPERPEATIAYFYCVRSTKGVADCDPNRVLRSLLRQLVWTSDNSIDENTADAMRGRKGLPSTDCINLLVQQIKTTDRTTIIIDALDECEDFELLLEHLVDLSERCKPQLRLFLSSRDHIEVQRPSLFPGCRSLRALRPSPTLTWNTSLPRRCLSIRRTNHTAVPAKIST